MNIVTAQNLTKDYDGYRAVDHIDFTIGKGECFGFLGPNGAGKTTVMRIISCFMPPTAGVITVCGMNAATSPSQIKARLGIMPQDINLDPELNVLENLVVYARYFNIRKKDALRRAHVLLELVDLTDKADVEIIQLSGGMKQRLLLARALLNNPDILILDEPTTGMDPHSRHTVWSKLNHLKSHKTTLLLTTHNMAEAERFCDRVAIMHAGKILALDSPQNLMAMHNSTKLEDVYLNLTVRGHTELSGTHSAKREDAYFDLAERSHAN